MKKKIAIFSVVATIIAAGLGVRTWLGESAAAPVSGKTSSARPEADAAPGVTLDAEAMERGGIETAPVAQGSHKAEIEAIATALPAQELIDAAAAISAAKAQAEKADAALAASRREHMRLKGLHADDRNVSDKAVEAAEAVRRGDEAAFLAARVGLDAVVNGTRRRWGDPLTNSVLENGPLFRRLAEGKEVLLRVASPSGQRLPAPPTLEIGADASRSMTAKLISVSPQTDPRIQGTAYLYAIAADGVAPGMTLAARLPSGPEEKGATLPASALVWWQGKAWGYVPTATGRFERREVVGARQVADGWFVPDFPAGSVAVRGVQTLLSEELRAGIRVGEEDK